MPKFRKVSSEVEASQFFETTIEGGEALADWCRGSLRGIKLPHFDRVIEIYSRNEYREARYGDWIVKEDDGSFIPYSVAVFNKLYEPA